MGLLLLLAVANVMSNRVLPGALYVPWNASVAVACVWWARAEVTVVGMGFASWRRGAAWGLTLLVLTVAVMAAAVAMPAFHDLYRDKRVHDGVWTVLYQAGVRIPLGTVLLEETAFRAVLPAVLAVRLGVGRACVVASLLFGAWHVLPALGLNQVNPTATEVFGSGAGGTIAAVVFAVVGTTFAGLWFCWLRYRSGSVLTTMLAHVGTNSVGYVIAWFVR